MQYKYQNKKCYLHSFVKNEYLYVESAVIQSLGRFVVLLTSKNLVEQDKELGKDLPEQTLRACSKINGHLDVSRERRFTIVDCDTNPSLQLLLAGKSSSVAFVFTHSCGVYHWLNWCLLMLSSLLIVYFMIGLRTEIILLEIVFISLAIICITIN